MLIEVKVPQLSESVAEATLVRWHKKVGEAFTQASDTMSQMVYTISFDPRAGRRPRAARVPPARSTPPCLSFPTSCRSFFPWKQGKECT